MQVFSYLGGQGPQDSTAGLLLSDSLLPSWDASSLVDLNDSF
jgi:hypothetical protein